MSRARVIFLGNNERTLQTLLRCDDVDVVAAVYERDHGLAHTGRCDTELRGRGGCLVAVPKDTPAELPALLQRFGPCDLILVSIFTILPKAVLDYPRCGCMNIHPSLLPHYKGAHPLQWVLLNGEAATGVSFMHLERHIDAGGIYHKVEIPITDDDDALTLAGKVDAAVDEHLPAILPRVLSGELRPQPQKEAGSYFPPLTAAVRYVNFRRMSARKVHNLTRSQVAYGGCMTTWNQKRLSFSRSRILEETSTAAWGGRILAVEAGPAEGDPAEANDAEVVWLHVQCVRGSVALQSRDPAVATLRGGDVLGT